MSRGGILLMLALLLPASPGAAQLPAGYALQVEMRDSGYVLGDLIEQHLSLRMPAGAQLEAESVPVQGRVNNWLELRERRIEQFGHRCEITLSYQVFGAVESALQLEIPGFRLRLREGERTLAAEVPPRLFYLSPVLPAVLSDEDRKPRSSPPPEPVPEAPPLLAAVLALLVAALLALFLAWAYDRLPFLPRSPGPLTRLFRKLRRIPAVEYGNPATAELLQDVLIALNDSARETLYADNLGLLFERVPALSPLRERIEALFGYSRELFYGTRPPEPSWSTADVIDLCRTARNCERGLR